jgi:hypothetical protein
VALNKNYAGIGFSYVGGVGFHPPQPYPSWRLHQSTYLWEPPTPMPDDGTHYRWDESTESWVEL